MNKKKGLSPVIATVLLIAIVVAMALIIFLWFRGMTEEEITKFGGEHIKLSCDKVEYTAEFSDNILYISNTGNVPIYSLRIDAIYDNQHKSKDLDQIFAVPAFREGSLIQGGTYSGDISDHTGSANSIKIIPILVGNSEEVQKSYVCEDSRSVKEI